MASLPLLRPLPSMMHHHHHHPSSSSSVSPNTHLLSDYSSAAQTVRLPTFHRSTTLLRVSSLHLNHHHPIITPSPQTLTKMKTTPFPCSSSSSSCFLRHPNTIDSSTSTTTSSISICRASSSSSSSSEVVPAKDRILSAVAYLLPFFNGLNFGVFLFDRFPILELAFNPFVPLFSFYKSIPGANFMAFLALCFGVVRDRGFSRYVRRNALQATMLDVLLALPSLVNIVFDSHKGLKFRLLEISYGATFLVIVAGFLYAFGLSVLGRNPKFPFVSEAVDWQLSAVDRQF